MIEPSPPEVPGAPASAEAMSVRPGSENGRAHPPSDVDRVAHLAAARARIVEQIRKRIVGQDEVIELMLVALFSRGHGLFVGVPGLAKTLLISTLGEVLSLRSSRIQFTPDLMPTDITGTEVLEDDAATGQRRFRFVPGPIFTNILLADEINRTPPKTQAALLQSMAEGAVTAGGRTHVLEKPYVVFATQNPIELEGTYPLPEAQLDRFMMNIQIGYLSEEEELAVSTRSAPARPEDLEPVLTGEDIAEFAGLVRRVPIAEPIARHAVQLVQASRPANPAAPQFIRDWVGWGAGTRASQNLILAARCRALLKGRHHVSLEDIRAVAAPVLRHRILTNFRAEADHVSVEAVIERLLKTVPEPRSGL